MPISEAKGMKGRRDMSKSVAFTKKRKIREDDFDIIVEDIT